MIIQKRRGSRQKQAVGAGLRSTSQVAQPGASSVQDTLSERDQQQAQNVLLETPHDPSHPSQRKYEPSSAVQSSFVDTQYSSQGLTNQATSMTSVSQQLDEVKEPELDIADRLTIRSQTDAITLALGVTEELRLVGLFVEQLLQALHQQLGHMPELDGVKESAVKLLIVYTTLMKEAVSYYDRFDRGAIDFVRSRRIKIANMFESFGHAKSDVSGDNFSEVSETNLPSCDTDVPPFDVTAWLQGVADDLPQEAQEAAVEQLSAGQVHESRMRRFLTENDAWTWLISRLGHTCNIGSQSLSEQILEDLEANDALAAGKTVRVRYKIDWQPRQFLHDQFPADQQPALSDVITITSFQDEYLATTCGDYARSMWPTFGLEVLHTIEWVVNSGHAKTILLPHHTSITVQLEDTAITVDVTSHTAIVADIGEFLGWLGCACRASPLHDRNLSCVVTPSVFRLGTTHQYGASLQCDLKFRFSELNVNDNTSDSCWQGLFRNVSIAAGFAVPKRWKNEPGLEISAQLMILLGDTPWANVHNGCFMLKGFSSIYIPIEVHEGSVFWHFVRQDEGFIPYSMASSSCIRKTHLTSRDLEWLFQQRHFVGWTARAEKHLGTETNDYSAIEDPNTDFMRSGMVLKEASISTGKFLNLEITAARGNHQQPLAAIRSSDYIDHLKQVSKINVILYDTGHKKAWLVDGASALLHITCAQLCSADFVREHNLLSTDLAQYASRDLSPFDVLRDWKTRRLVIRYEGDQSEETRGESETSRNQNGIWRFGDLVASNCDYLLKMHEHQVRPLSGIDVRFTSRDRLEGWSFMDVVEHMAFIQPRMVYLRPSGRGWTHYTRVIHAVTLMGEGFGELITPAIATCQHWKTVPGGRDYLTTTVDRLLWNSRKYGNSKDFPAFIANDVRWHQPYQLFEDCSCPKKWCNPVQVVLPKVSFAIRQPPTLDGRYKDGAVIFGQNERFRLWYPMNPRQDPELDLDGVKESRASTMCAEPSMPSKLDLLGPSQSEELGSLSGSDSTDRRLLSPVISNATYSTTPATSFQSRQEALTANEDKEDLQDEVPPTDAREDKIPQLFRSQAVLDICSSPSIQQSVESSQVHEPGLVAKSNWRKLRLRFVKRSEKH